VGWLQTKFPEKFGIVVDVSASQKDDDKEQSNA